MVSYSAFSAVKLTHCAMAVAQFKCHTMTIEQTHSVPYDNAAVLHTEFIFAPVSSQRLRPFKQRCSGMNRVPSRAPSKMPSIASGFALVQITRQQPAAVAMRAAVSLVTMPPVPHCVPVVLVSAVREEMSSTSWMGVAVGSSCGQEQHHANLLKRT
jgi:hypothetical protein